MAGLKSPKTLWAGVIGAAVVILTQIGYALDEDAATTLDANEILAAVVALYMLINGLISRDADKSSEDSGL
jgi:hypothetical protein